VSLAERRWLRLFTLSVLYVAQGIPWGFMATTLPAYLTERGLDFGFVAATLSFTTLPYSFKWIWGPVIDTVSLPRFGRRRSWILFAQAMMATTVAIMFAIDPTTDLKLLAWMILIHTTFNSLQDVAVDALAVELLADDERGSANGLMYGSKYFGGAIGGIGMATIIRWTSFDTALGVQVVLLLAIMMVPFLVREREGPAPPQDPPREIASALVQAFSLRSNLVAAVLMLISTFAVGIVGATGFKLFVTELGWDYHAYTGISGGWGLLVGGTVAMSAGPIVDRLGPRRIAFAASVLLAGGWAAFAMLEPHWRETWLVYASGLYGEGCVAITQVALIALCMELSWPKIGGSQFAGYMALSNFSTTLGYLAAAKVNELWSYREVYLLAGAWQVASMFLLLAIDRTETRRKLPLPAGTRVVWYGPAALAGLLVFLVGMTVYITQSKL